MKSLQVSRFTGESPLFLLSVWKIHVWDLFSPKWRQCLFLLIESPDRKIYLVNIAWQIPKDDLRPETRGPLKSGAWGGRTTCHPQTPPLVVGIVTRLRAWISEVTLREGAIAVTLLLWRQQFITILYRIFLKSLSFLLFLAVTRQQ